MLVLLDEKGTRRADSGGRVRTGPRWASVDEKGTPRAGTRRPLRTGPGLALCATRMESRSGERLEWRALDVDG